MIRRITVAQMTSVKRSGEVSAGSSPRAIPRAMVATHRDSKLRRRPMPMA
jgi:hypothetical protein